MRHVPEYQWRDSINNMLLFYSSYMYRRCSFLDNLPAFNFNRGRGEYYQTTSGEEKCSDTRELGSTLMKAMLREVSDFCDPDIKQDWSQRPHQQVIITCFCLLEKLWCSYLHFSWYMMWTKKVEGVLDCLLSFQMIWNLRKWRILRQLAYKFQLCSKFSSLS